MAGWRLFIGILSQLFSSVLPLHLSLFFPLSNLISFDGCLERGLMTEMWGFSIHENGILSKDWLAKL